MLFNWEMKSSKNNEDSQGVISLSVQNPSALHHHYHNKETKTLLLSQQNPDCYLTIMTQPWLHYLSAMTTLMKIQTMLPHCNENPECTISLSWQPWLLSHCHYENLTHCAVSLPWQKPWLTMLSHCPDKTLTNCVISRSWQNHIHHYKTLTDCAVSLPRQKPWLTMLSHCHYKTLTALSLCQNKILTNGAISPPWQNPCLTMLFHCHDKTISITTKPWLTVLSHCQDKNPDSLCYLIVMTKPYLSVQNPNCAVSPPRQKNGLTVLSHWCHKNLTHCAISLPWQKPDPLCYPTALTKTWLTFSWPCWGRMGWGERGWQLTLIQDPAQGPQHRWPHHGGCEGFAARCPDPLHFRRCLSRWLAHRWSPQTSLWDNKKWCALKLCVCGYS